MRACCTYCSIEVSASPDPMPAVRRWASDRVKNAERFAEDRKLDLLLLTAERGLVGKDDPLKPGRADLSDEDIGRRVSLVANQLGERKIRELSFLINPSHRLALAYLRLITLACYRAGVTLELLDYRGGPFPEWSKAFTQAEQARRRALKPGMRVEDAFLKFFPTEDAMIWFKRGEAYRDKSQYREALANFEQADELFTILEWRQAAKSQAKAALEHLPKRRFLSISIQYDLKEVDRLALATDVKRLSAEAIRVADESPSALILLCRVAIQRVDDRLKGIFPPPLRMRINELKSIRDDIAHGSRTGTTDEAKRFKSLLFDVLKFAHGRQWSR